MKNTKRLIPILFLLLLSMSSFAMKKTIVISASEDDAKIYKNGKYIGEGQANIVVVSNSCATIEVRKVGYLTQKVKFCNNKYSAKPPKTFFFSCTAQRSASSPIGEAGVIGYIAATSLKAYAACAAAVFPSIIENFAIALT